LIRGDIRYSKLINKARAIIERTINDWVAQIEILKQKNVKFYLTALPTPESDDVTTTLQQFTQFTSDALAFIVNDSKEASLARLEALTSLFSQQTNIKSVEKWADSVRKVIDETFKNPGEAPVGEGSESQGQEPAQEEQEQPTQGEQPQEEQ